jgi:hypothetical protein
MVPEEKLSTRLFNGPRWNLRQWNIVGQKIVAYVSSLLLRSKTPNGNT